MVVKNRQGRAEPLATADADRPRGTCDKPAVPDSLDYWADAEKWQELGRKVQADAAEERRTGVPPAGASVRLSIFRSLRKRLDRRAR